jgi:polygalacturonase
MYFMFSKKGLARCAKVDKATVKSSAIIILTLVVFCIFGIKYFAGNSVTGYIESVTASASPGDDDRGSPDWLNVRAFGAAGDGVTDDTNAIQAAIDAGTRLYFPTGTYVVNQLFISDASDVVLYGYGATLMKKAGSVTWTRILDITSSDNIQILGLTFDGNKPHVAGSPQAGCGSIYGTHLTNFLLKDLKICNSYYGTVNLTDCHYGRITECSFDDIDCGIIGMGRANSYLDIDRCVFSNGTSEGISFGIYTAVTSEGFANIGYHDQIAITNCRFMNKDANCIQLRNVKNVLVANNYLERTDSSKGTVGIMIDPDSVTSVNIVPDNIVIHTNRITGMRYEGIKVTRGTKIIIKNNCFDGIQSFNITAGCGCTIGNNIFINIQPEVRAIIYAPGRDVKILDNHFMVDAVEIPCVICVLSDITGILAQGNVLWKDSANPCVVLDSEYGSVAAAQKDLGFSVITAQ